MQENNLEEKENKMPWQASFDLALLWMKSLFVSLMAFQLFKYFSFSSFSFWLLLFLLVIFNIVVTMGFIDGIKKVIVLSLFFTLAILFFYIYLFFIAIILWYIIALLFLCINVYLEFYCLKHPFYNQKKVEHKS